MKLKAAKKSIIGFAVGAFLPRNTDYRFEDQTPESKIIYQHYV